MRPIFVLISLSFVIAGPGFANTKHVCAKRFEIPTPTGVFLRQDCENPLRNGRSESQFWLNKKKLIYGPSPITLESQNEAKTLFLLEDNPDPELFCPARMFLIDLTGKAPRVFSFGIKNACAEYHWASWGKKRSVIAVKYNIRFTYHNGKLLPPPNDFGDGEPLSRRFPEDGNKPLAPFVEEIPIR